MTQEKIDLDALIGALESPTGEWNEPEWSIARRKQAAAALRELRAEVAGQALYIKSCQQGVESAEAECERLRVDADNWRRSCSELMRIARERL